jgi:penicillin-binding protein 1B
MDWEVMRVQAGVAWQRFGQQATRRRVLTAVGGVALVGSFAIVSEALIRARLQSPQARMLTTVYSRPVSWQTGDSITPVAIGTLDGRAAEYRIPFQLAQVPTPLVQAILAVEDQRFFDHHGLDLRRIAGALVADVRAGGIAQGGSTLTQQLAKNLFLSADRTPLRKLREAAMAVVLELRYSKPQILEAYLNEIYLGQDGGRSIHGVGAASRYYFGKDLHRLTLPEAAQLAAMISAPNRNVATRHPEAAAQRRNLVLDLMAQQHRITAAAAERAERTEVASSVHATATIDARYFRDFIAGTMANRTPARGTAIYSTLDPQLQHAAERAIVRSPVRGAEAALVALDPRTGEILAMVGGKDYAQSQFNRAVTAERQPGSAFKPIVALAALQPGGRDQSPQYTLASTVDDEPLRVQTPSGPWQPEDYDHQFRGAVTVREAMEQSLNLPFARIGLALGPQRMVAEAERVGIQSPLRAVPSLALGSSEVNLLELVRAYGVLAASGLLVPTRSLVAEQHDGVPLPLQRDSLGVQVVDPAVAYLVTSSLQGVVTRGTARALNPDGRYGEIAAKTGTSNDWRDAWFIAYTPTLVVGVWVGYDDGRSLNLTGAAAALPIASRNYRSLFTGK